MKKLLILAVLLSGGLVHADDMIEQNNELHVLDIKSKKIKEIIIDIRLKWSDVHTEVDDCLKACLSDDSNVSDCLMQCLLKSSIENSKFQKEAESCMFQLFDLIEKKETR